MSCLICEIRCISTVYSTIKPIAVFISVWQATPDKNYNIFYTCSACEKGVIQSEKI